MAKFDQELEQLCTIPAFECLAARRHFPACLAVVRRSRGVTLILVAAVLSILAAMATGFYVLMLMQTRSAAHYADGVRAGMLGQAGISYALSQLRAQAFQKPEDPTNAWYTVDYLHGGARNISYPDSPLLHDGVDQDKDGQKDNPEEAFAYRSDPALPRPYGYSLALTNSASVNLSANGPSGYPIEGPSDRFSLSVSDAASRINLNACDNLGVVLDNLCRVIGPPLVAARLEALQPRRWYVEMTDAGDAAASLFAPAGDLNKNDTALNMDLYYSLSDDGGKPPPPPPATPGATYRPIRGADGVAIYGDGYAIAGYRSRHGLFRNLEDVKSALTYVERSNPANGTPDLPLEQLEIEVKFAALRDYITISSWVDTNTVCVGKFEWVHFDTSKNKTYAIDRDKSWVADDLTNDPLNLRGSLRGCYVSIMNGHGAGQLRRIRSNGIDWIEVDPPTAGAPAFAVTPGPASSYMIVANEDATLVGADGGDLDSYPDKPPRPGTLAFPKTNTDLSKGSLGTLVDNPKIDYSLHPLCIHRAPVNVNTASDKVLAALLLGLNVQHGHPMALGTDADVDQLRKKWKQDDPHKVVPYLLTPAGLKRLPAASGMPVYNPKAPLPPAASKYDFSYLSNYGVLKRANYGLDDPYLNTEVNPVLNLVYRILVARQYDPALQYTDLSTGDPTSSASHATNRPNYKRGPFLNYDDLYFRVVKPFAHEYLKAGWVDTDGDGILGPGDTYHHADVARLIMANLNSNTDILKFNPNIEWIDRWGRNFIELEAVMIYTNDRPDGADNSFTKEPGPKVADPITASSIPIYAAAPDQWNGTPPLSSSKRDPAQVGGGNSFGFIRGAYVTRNYRYRSDDLIDKTDLNRSTTELSFDSNGIFEITSVGQVVKGGQVLAERKFIALAKVYDVWRESTQAQFVQGRISKAWGDRGTSCSGQLARDAYNIQDRLALTTLPEPLVPIEAKILDARGSPNAKNVEVVTVGGQPLDAYGNPRKNPYDTGVPGIQVPDIIANRVLPASYDGQIVLATNTAAFDKNGDEDTFLATFDGDLDTATCIDNGREQAKWPSTAVWNSSSGLYTYVTDNTGTGHKHRCVHTVGLLGVLNDTNVDMDPGLAPIPPSLAGTFDPTRWVYNFNGISTCLQGLKPAGADPDRPYYWNNVTVQMGNLRTDGVYLTAPGVSGNNATLKYVFGPALTKGDVAKPNFQPDSQDGNCITMWAKPAWHHNDDRHHEFFNAGNPGEWNVARGCFIHKYGQYTWTLSDLSSGAGNSANRFKLNDLAAFWERDSSAAPGGEDWDFGPAIHGGYSYYSGAAPNTDPAKGPVESPGYRVQPFRWHFVGCRQNYRSSNIDGASEGDGPRGHWMGGAGYGDWESEKNKCVTTYHVRPFIDTQLTPEGEKTWKSWLFWSFRSAAVGGLTHCQIGDPGVIVDDTNPNLRDQGSENGCFGQDVKWPWADPQDPLPPATTSHLKSFGLNNLNYGNLAPIKNDGTDRNGSTEDVIWHYRHTPDDGTYAVIDELKISSKDTVLRDDGPKWWNDRVTRNKDDPLKPGEMYLSRYYLPPQPGSKLAPAAGGAPTFSSQTLLQSLKGFDKTKNGQNVAVVRVSWNVFTPRFMCEYKVPDSTRIFKRKEVLSNVAPTGPYQLGAWPYKGPFDYVTYNDYKEDYKDVSSFYSVNRPSPADYQKYNGNKTGLAQAGRGVEVELLCDKDGANDSGDEVVLGGATFTDPTSLNVLGKQDKPVWVLTHQLRYRVRFRYPRDPLVDDPANTVTGVDGKPSVDTANQYLLDTPVFDDVSVTYIIPPRMLELREVTE